MADDRLDDPWAAFAAASTSQLEPSLTRPSLSRRSSSANLAASDLDATTSKGLSRTAAHPLRHESDGNYGEATRPSLRRLVVDGSGRQETSVWIGGGDSRRSLDGWAGKGKGRAVEAGEDQRKREVLIHPVGKAETLAGISLSYGISVSPFVRA